MKRTISYLGWIGFTALALLAVPCHLFAQALPETKAVELWVGDKAPDFKLADQNGQEVSLKDLLKHGPVAVVFYRSADWCLYCKLQLTKIQRNLREIEATGGRVVAVSYDPEAILKRFAKNQRITYPLLSDFTSKTIDAYHIRNPDTTGKSVGSANHCTFVIDGQGIVRSRLGILDADERPAVEQLVKALNEAKIETGVTKR